MSLIPYNKKSELLPFGFRNIGATCYFNAIIQSLLSCTSFTDELLQKKERDVYEKNPVAKVFIELIEASVYYNDLCLKLIDDDPSIVSMKNEAKNKLQEFSPILWKQMIILLCKKKKIPIQTFMQGQQCAGEGYHYILETMEEFQVIQNLFLHRYKSLIRCFDCDKWVSDVENMYNLFEIEPDLKVEQIDKFKDYHTDAADMNEFLSKKTGYVDDNFICPSCKQKNEKYRMDVLVMVPEILVVMAKKYDKRRKLNVYTNFPEKLTFKGKQNNDMCYEAVAQIEHSGGRNGGHYWAKCRRKNGWYDINDMTVSPSKYQPTVNTYIVLYHIMSK